MGDERAQKKQQRAHARNRKICSTLHNHKSRRTVTITNRFIAAIERKLLQIEFAANVAGFTFYLYKAHLQGQSRHVDGVVLHKFYHGPLHPNCQKAHIKYFTLFIQCFFSFFSCSEDNPLSMSDFNRRAAQGLATGAFFFKFGLGGEGGKGGGWATNEPRKSNNARTLETEKYAVHCTTTNRAERLLSQIGLSRRSNGNSSKSRSRRT